MKIFLTHRISGNRSIFLFGLTNPIYRTTLANTFDFAFNFFHKFLADQKLIYDQILYQIIFDKGLLWLFKCSKTKLTKNYIFKKKICMIFTKSFFFFKKSYLFNKYLYPLSENLILLKKIHSVKKNSSCKTNGFCKT